MKMHKKVLMSLLKHLTICLNRDSLCLGKKIMQKLFYKFKKDILRCTVSPCTYTVVTLNNTEVYI